MSEIMETFAELQVNLREKRERIRQLESELTALREEHVRLTAEVADARLQRDEHCELSLKDRADKDAANRSLGIARTQTKDAFERISHQQDELLKLKKDLDAAITLLRSILSQLPHLSVADRAERWDLVSGLDTRIETFLEEHA